MASTIEPIGPASSPTIPWVYGEIVRKLAPGEIVRIIVNSENHEARAQRVLTRSGVDLARVEFFRFPTNRGWTRDFGPIFVNARRPSRPEVPSCVFVLTRGRSTTTGRKTIGLQTAQHTRLGAESLEHKSGGRDVVLEGGAIDVNGQGTLIATEECLLDQITPVAEPRSFAR